MPAEIFRLTIEAPGAAKAATDIRGIGKASRDALSWSQQLNRSLQTLDASKFGLSLRSVAANMQALQRATGPLEQFKRAAAGAARSINKTLENIGKGADQRVAANVSLMVQSLSRLVQLAPGLTQVATAFRGAASGARAFEAATARLSTINFLQNIRSIIFTLTQLAQTMPVIQPVVLGMQNLANAVHMVASAFAALRLQAVQANAVLNTTLAVANQAAARGASAVRSVNALNNIPSAGQGMAKATPAAQTFLQRLNDIDGSIRRVDYRASLFHRTLGLLRAALVVFAAVNIAQRFVDMADAFILFQNRMKLVTSDTKVAVAVQRELFNISQDTGTSLETNSTLFFRTARAVAGLGYSYRQVLDVVKATSIAILLSGATTAEANGALIQFSQGLASNFRAAGQELNSVIEQLPELARILAKPFGVDPGRLRAFLDANKGALTTQVAVEALLAELPLLVNVVGQTQRTIGQALTRFGSAIQFFVGGLSQATGFGRELADVIDILANNIDKVFLAVVALAGVLVFNVVIDQVSRLNANLLLLANNALRAGGILAGVFLAPLAPLQIMRVAIVGVGNAFIYAFGVVPALIKAVVGSFLVLRATVLGVAAAFAAARVFVIGFFAALRAGTAITFLFQSAVVAVRTAMLGLAAVMAVLSAPLTLPFLVGAAVIGALIGLFIYFQDEIEETIKSLGGFEGIFNTIASTGMGVVTTLINSWELFPPALEEVWFDVVQGFETAWGGMFKWLDEQYVAVLNGFLAKSESVINAVGKFFHDNTGVGLPSTPYQGVSFPRVGREQAGGRREGTDLPVNPNRGSIAALRAQIDANIAAAAGGQTTHPDFSKPSLSPFDAIKKAGIDVVEFLEALASGELSDAMKVLLDGLIEGTGTTTDLGNGLDDIKKKYQSLLSSISPLANIMFELNDAENAVNEAQKAGFDLGLSREEVLRRVARQAVGVGNAETDYRENVQLLDQQLEKGNITYRERFARLRELQGATRDLINETSPLASYLDAVSDAEDALTLNLGTLITSEEQYNDVLGRKKRELSGVGNFVEEYSEHMAVLNAQLADGTIQLYQFNKAQRALEQDSRSLVNSVSPRASFNDGRADQDATLQEAEAAGIKLALDAATVKRRLAREFVGVGNAADYYGEKLGIVVDLQKEGALSADEFERSVAELRIEFLDTQRDFSSGAERALLKFHLDATDTATQVEGVISGALDHLTDAFVEFAKTGKFEFSSLADFAVEQLARIAFEKLFLDNVLGAAGGFDGILGTILGAVAPAATAGGGGLPSQGPQFQYRHGGAFLDGQIVAHMAQGALVSKRMLVPMAEMGEAGPEGIFPLTRTAGGDLGIQAVGGNSGPSSVTVNVWNNGEPAEAEAEVTQDAQGNMAIDVMIDRIVAKKISQAGSASHQALRSRFGVNPTTITRG